MLFTPITLGKLHLNNRIVVPPMCMYQAMDGQVQDFHLMHYGSMANSGAGLIIMEATAVEPEGRISAHDLGLWSEEAKNALSHMLKKIRTFSSTPFAVQLSHAGRKASAYRSWEGGKQVSLTDGGWATVAPCALPFEAHERVPVALDKKGLVHIKNSFVQATKRAAEIGIDALEIHNAHGYLLHEFLSPLSNIRTDEYGGSLENRMRFPLEVFDAVRQSFPADLPVGVRLSATDWVDRGWDVEESKVFATALQQHGCGFLHVSSGGLSPLQRIALGAGYQLPLAAGIRNTLQQTFGSDAMPVIAVGLITEPEQANEALITGKADMIALGRAMLYNPHWPWHAATKLGATVHTTPSYWRSQPQGVKDLFVKES